MLYRMCILCLGHWSEEEARAQFLERWLQLKQLQSWPISKHKALVPYYVIGDQWLFPGVFAPFIGIIVASVRSLWCKLRGVARYAPYEIVCLPDAAQARALLDISTVHLSVVRSASALSDLTVRVQNEIAALNVSPRLASYAACLDGDDVLYIKRGQSESEPARVSFAKFVAEIEQDLR